MVASITAELEARGLNIPPENAAVVKRVIHTTADFDYAVNLRFTGAATDLAISSVDPATGATNGDNAKAMMAHTYTRGGLPPTPSALPGPASIEAALKPEATRALYFVARGDGSSQFSRTLEEHNQAVNRYQKGGKR